MTPPGAGTEARVRTPREEMTVRLFVFGSDKKKLPVSEAKSGPNSSKRTVATRADLLGTDNKLTQSDRQSQMEVDDDSVVNAAPPRAVTPTVSVASTWRLPSLQKPSVTGDGVIMSDEEAETERLAAGDSSVALSGNVSCFSGEV
jgi:hypothetical protein